MRVRILLAHSVIDLEGGGGVKNTQKFDHVVYGWPLTVHFILLKKTHIIMKYLCFIIIILLVRQGFSKGISILDQIRGLEQKVKKLENENVELKKQNNADNNDLDILKSKIVS